MRILKDNSQVIKGDIVFSMSSSDVKCVEDGFLVVVDGICQGVFEYLPEEYEYLDLIDYSGKIILPGMSDIHVHASQYGFRGLGMNLELLDWLNTYTFKEEAKFFDKSYAHKAYSIFVEDLLSSMTTRACIFATIHTEGTLELMKLLEKSGLKTMVGKVNMDRECPNYLCEDSARKSIEDTEKFIIRALKNYNNTKPIITPRFVPTCSDVLMRELSKLREKYNLKVQSHLSENKSEIELVSELNKESKFYGDAYDMFGLFGGEYDAVMAHCVYSLDKEIELMKKNNVFVAHCPASNMNLASGIAPIRKYMDNDINIGLGTDIGAGHSISMFRCITDSVQVSKLYWRLIDESCRPIDINEAFYLATVGGGKLFGKVGSFDKGYEADIVVYDDSNLKAPYKMSLQERFERLLYLGSTDNVISKYVSGEKIYDRKKKVSNSMMLV